MRTLGLDVGDERTGVAISDPGGILATPLTVLASRDKDALIIEILNLVEQNHVKRIVVGLPRHLSGELGRQANRVTDFVEKLSNQARQANPKELDIQLWDERLSTKAASRLKTGNVTKEGRQRPVGRRDAGHKKFSAKAEVDAIAAAIILQAFLDSCRTDDGAES